MKNVKLRESSEFFELYLDKKSISLLYYLGALVTFVCGLILFCIYFLLSQIEILKYFGFGFCFFGFLLVVTSYFKLKSISKSGFVLLKITKNSINCTPAFGLKSTVYQWGHFRKIIVTGKFTHQKYDGSTTEGDSLIFIFKDSQFATNAFENSKTGRFRAESDELFMIFSLPKNISKGRVISSIKSLLDENSDTELVSLPFFKL